MTAAPEITHLVAVERWTLVLGALLLGVGLLFLPSRTQLSLGLGVGLMIVNAWIIRRLSARLLPVWSGGRGSVGLLMILFNAKLVLLALALYLCVRYLPVEPVPLCIGLSILPLAILLRAIQHGLRDPEKAETHG